MNKLEKQHFRMIGDHSANSFFQLMINEGSRLSLIDSARLQKFQNQFMELLTDQLNRYTGGRSSSVPVETAQRIQLSTLYTIGYYLKDFSNLETAFDVLMKDTLINLHKNGNSLIEKHRNDAAQLLNIIQENSLSTNVYAYNATLREGLPMFFKHYDFDYGTHETPASIDYSLGVDKTNLTGIEYIYGYLKSIQLENEFCEYFPNEDIHSLLKGYDRNNKDLLFNIYDLVLNNAIGSLLLGRDGIIINDFDRQYLQREFSDLSKEELNGYVDKAVSKLCKTLPILNPQLQDYVKNTTATLKFRLKNALETNSLKNLFLSSEEDIDELTIQFEDTNKLDDESFRTLADEVRECRFVSDKIALIKRTPLSMIDFLDLLEGDCFFEDEFPDMFRSLEDVQLALLTKKLPLDPVDSYFLQEESEKEWIGCFNTFLNKLDPIKKETVFKMAKHIAWTFPG